MMKKLDLEQAIDVALGKTLPVWCEVCEYKIDYKGFNKTDDFVGDITDIVVAQLNGKGVDIK